MELEFYSLEFYDALDTNRSFVNCLYDFLDTFTETLQRGRYKRYYTMKICNSTSFLPCICKMQRLTFGRFLFLTLIGLGFSALQMAGGG